MANILEIRDLVVSYGGIEAVKGISLDVEQGKETFRQIIENLRGEARVPDEFVAKAAHVRNLMES